MSKSMAFHEAFVLVLEQLVGQAKRLSETDLKAILSGKAKLEINLVPTQSRPRKMHQPKSDEEYQVILEDLQACKSRQDGEVFLEKNFPTKALLADFARYLDIPVLKRDKVSQLREKVIEATVGAVLRSRAIQGHEERSIV